VARRQIGAAVERDRAAVAATRMQDRRFEPRSRIALALRTLP
jgi:hypothetical protein